MWKLASRSPLRLARDVATAFRDPAVLLRGTVRLVTGLLLLTAAAGLVIPICDDGHDFLVLETWTLVTALLVDQLVGSDLTVARNRR